MQDHARRFGKTDYGRYLERVMKEAIVSKVKS
jgi:hypothetical protein